jgi:hypothetical protein
MTTATGNLITAADVNNLIDTVTKVYATGTGDYGYGQGNFTLADVSSGKKISAQDWISIRGMLLACSNHQGTQNSALFPDPSIGVKILSASSAIAIATACSQNRLVAATGSLTQIDNVASASFATAWNGVLQATVDVSFASEDKARFFFNSGGLITIDVTQAVGTTAQDISFRNFLARQLGTIYIGAHTTRITGTATVSVVPNAGYYEFSSAPATIVSQVSTSYVSTQADQIVVQAQRTGYSGTRGGNGIGFQVVIQATFMGDSNGSLLTAGMLVEVDTIEATKYLTVSSPNCAVSGFQQIAAGNPPPGGGPGGGPGGVQTIPPYDPAPGTVTYVVPDYATIMFELKGGGGSQGSSTGPYPRSDGATIYLAPGTNGGDATVTALGLTAKGGSGGGIYDLTNNVPGPVGTDGVGTGGDVNTTGGGGAGGSGKYAGLTNYFNGSAGGAGAYVKKTYVRGAPGAPNPGDILTLTIPAGGSQTNLPIPVDTPTVFFPGADGAKGQVKITVTTSSSGSVSFKTPGTYKFTVPSYSQITFDVNGAGGGQGGPFFLDGIPDYYVNGVPTDPLFLTPLPDGGTGGASSIPELSIVANGGAGGTYAPLQQYAGPTQIIGPTEFGQYAPLLQYQVIAQAGANGTATGAQQDLTGQGAAGGYILYFGDPTAAAQNFAYRWHEGANGGNGGRAVSTFAPTDTGAPAVGAVLTINVGSGGPPAPIAPTRVAAYGTVYATGNNGYVNISWSGSTTTVTTPT